MNGAPFCRYADGTPEGCVQNAVFGTYLHGLFDSGELTEQLAAYLCRRKGIAPETAAPLPMAAYRANSSWTCWPTACAAPWTWTPSTRPWVLYNPEEEKNDTAASSAR